MKYAALAFLISTTCTLFSEEPKIIPANPPLAELTKRASDAAIVLVCQPNEKKTAMQVLEVVKGEKEYTAAKDQIATLIQSDDKKALATKGYKELFFISPANDNGMFSRSNSVALWPPREEKVDSDTIRFLSHEYADVKKALQDLR